MSARSTGRVVALDVGEAYTGVALSDPGATLARPLEAVPSEGLDGYLRELFADNDVVDVVFGLPRTMGGEVGHQARRVLERVEELRRAFPGVRFVEWDERLTTKVARAAVGGSGRGGRKKGRRGVKQRVDHLAAAAMLQEYLDRRGTVAQAR